MNTRTWTPGWLGITTLLLARAALPAPELELGKVVNNGSPAPNEPVEFTIEVKNSGDTVAVDVWVQDRLPEGLVIPAGMAAFTSSGSYNAVTGRWDVGDLQPGESGVMTLPTMRDTDSPPPCIVNIATGQIGEGPDTAVAARAAIRDTAGRHCVDLQTDFGINAGEFFVFPTCDKQDRYIGWVRVRNLGPDPARGVRVSLSQSPVVGAAIRFDDADCSNAPGATCQVGELAAGAEVEITVTSDLFQSYSASHTTIAVVAESTDTEYSPTDNDPQVTRTTGGFSNCDEPDFAVGTFAAPAPCFIATAAWGSPLHPRIDALRDFRDRYLLTNRPGRAFVAFYYRHSPPIADFIAERDWLRALVRWALTPLVYAASAPAVTAMLFGLALLGVWIRRRRRT